MKKLNIFLMMALALCFTSCEEEWVEALPQQNEQEALFTAEDFVANNALADAITLTAAEGETELEVANFVSVSNLPEGAIVEFTMQMAKNEDFSDAVDVKVSNAANVATAKIADLQAAYQSVQGRNPEARTVNVRYAAYVVNGTEKVRVNGIDTYYGVAKVVVTPYDPGFRMEKKYYLVWAEDPEAISLDANVVELNHSDKDVYDDTKFSVVIDVQGDFNWLIIGQSALDAKNLDAAMGAEEGMEYEATGLLFAKNNEDFPGFAICHDGTGKYQFEVDMYSNAEEEVYPVYTVTPAFDNLWSPGNSNGWNHANSNMLFTGDYITYNGYVYLDGEFKFSNAADWSHTNYGNAGEEGALSTNGGAGNLSAEKGVYWATVNIPNLTYSLVKIETIGLIGGFNGWGSSLPMTEQINGPKDLKYVGEVTLKAGEEFKFRANDGWDINLGDDPNVGIYDILMGVSNRSNGRVEALTPNGDNLKVDEDGTYIVTLDLSNLPYTATVTKK